MNVVVNSIMTNESDVIGVWRLRAYYLEIVESGERIEPFGPKPKGVFMIHPDGRVVVVMTPAEQIKPATEADQAKAFQKLLAYSGRYRVEPPDRFVTAVDIAWFEPCGFVASQEIHGQG
jgi:Lipocalin-like domain